MFSFLKLDSVNVIYLDPMDVMLHAHRMGVISYFTSRRGSVSCFGQFSYRGFLPRGFSNDCVEWPPVVPRSVQTHIDLRMYTRYNSCKQCVCLWPSADGRSLHAHCSPIRIRRPRVTHYGDLRAPPSAAERWRAPPTKTSAGCVTRLHRAQCLHRYTGANINRARLSTYICDKCWSCSPDARVCIRQAAV